MHAVEVLFMCTNGHYCNVLPDNRSKSVARLPVEVRALTLSCVPFSGSARGELGGGLTAVPPLRSAVSTLISRCFGDTYLTSGAPAELGPVEKGTVPPGVYGSSKSSSFWSL